MPVDPFEPTVEEAVKSTIQLTGKDTETVIEDAMRRSEERMDSLCQQVLNEFLQRVWSAKNSVAKM